MIDLTTSSKRIRLATSLCLILDQDLYDRPLVYLSTIHLTSLVVMLEGLLPL
jgi:hypothetical protein